MLRWIIPALALAALACAPGALEAQTAQPRIIAGSDVPISTYPFQVSLRQMDGSFICGGSIRDATHVITAAHCVTAVPQRRRMPACVRSRVGYGSAFARLAVDRWRSTSLERAAAVSAPGGLDESYDVAVLTLSDPIDLSGPNAKAIPFVSPAQPEDAGSGIVTGWGDTSEGGNISQTLKGTRVRVARPTRPAPSYYGVRLRAGAGGLRRRRQRCRTAATRTPARATAAARSWSTSTTRREPASPCSGSPASANGCGRQNVPAAYTDVQGTGIAAFLDAPGTGRNEPPVPPAAPAPSVIATRDTISPTARVSRLACTRRRRCSIRIGYLGQLGPGKQALCHRQPQGPHVQAPRRAPPVPDYHA